MCRDAPYPVLSKFPTDNDTYSAALVYKAVEYILLVRRESGQNLVGPSIGET